MVEKKENKIMEERKRRERRMKEIRGKRGRKRTPWAKLQKVKASNQSDYGDLRIR